MLVEPRPMNPRVRRLWRFLWTRSLSRILEARSVFPTRELEGQMGFLDRLLGRGKKAAGDLIGDASMRPEDAAQERAGPAGDPAAPPRATTPEPRTPAA